ncbi:ATP-binding protein [Streptomyces sp. NBC_00102]|uniref:ATP-binding protein n=1 Tax=Streptomyces sp. NBC_00102 TaxID=2975652 RepID=UPI00225A8F24|nr:ATP-binding protein [Streptomyces sp. NBC_00102]MCX5397201.1 ATP-binding protein [Streptomyces sp. NBC_00102]
MDFTFDMTIDPDRVRIAQLRRITSVLVAEWASSIVVQDVAVVVSELVTNAIEHGHGAVGFRLSLTGEGLLLEVVDGNPAPARLRPAAADDEHGRGLLLVSCLAADWGVSEDGRTTWAFFRVGDGSP